MRRRNSLVEVVCQHHTDGASSKRIGRFLFYKQVAYCRVPKAGCTFWKRIFLYLNKDYQHYDTVSSPLDIPRHFVHKNTKLINLSNDKKQIQKFENIQETFMFTRDPYSRVWSAYLDKLFLPDFWLGLGLSVIKSERRNAKRHSLVCGDDVTFEEFVRHILTQPKRLIAKAHYAPVHTICDPCSINFTYIGKLETFKDDVYHILEDTGLNFILKMGLFNNTSSEIETLSEDYLELRKFGRKPQCKNVTLICERLWKVFQMNGYIGLEIPFPLHLLHTVRNESDIKQTFISHAISEHESGHALHELWKRQRRQSLVRAYKTLPTDLLRQFQAVYKKDFELFGYTKAPKDIFS